MTVLADTATPAAPIVAPVDSEFDLDVTIVESSSPVDRLMWNSGSNCDTNDGCGHTCESACSQSCTDGG